jgi:TRPM family ion channel
MSAMVARAAGLCLVVLALQVPKMGLHGPGPPHVIPARQAQLERNAELRALIEAVHRETDGIVVLCGGAAKMPEAKQRELQAMFAAIGTLAKERRIAVGDGGIKAGIMEAAGKARLASGGAFPLIGVAPAREIPPVGTTPIDPNHSHLVAVDDPALPKGEPAWGSETATMYWLFNRMAEGRNSVTIVADGGRITLREIAANVEAGRPMILIEGSGRAADAMVTLVRGTMPADGETHLLQNTAREMTLNRRPDLFRVVSISKGAPGLLEALRAELGPVLPRTR